MNYINALELDVKEQSEQLAEIQSELIELYKYLESPKFHVDTTVQVGDIFSRTARIRSLSIPNLLNSKKRTCPSSQSCKYSDYINPIAYNYKKGQ